MYESRMLETSESVCCVVIINERQSSNVDIALKAIFIYVQMEISNLFVMNLDKYQEKNLLKTVFEILLKFFLYLITFIFQGITDLIVNSCTNSESYKIRLITFQFLR